MIGRIRRYAAEHGVAATARRAAIGGVGVVYSAERATLLLKELDQIAKSPRGADVEVEPLEERHLAQLAELNRRRSYQSADRRFRDNLDRGLGGFVGHRGEELVGYYWWVDCANAEQHPDLDWLGDSLQIEPGDVYGSDFYLLPEGRGRGTAGAFLYQVETSLAAKGFKRLWGYVERSNRGARWLYSSRGYLPMGDVVIRRILRRRRVAVLPKVESNAA
jgi:GNAT superfamily N-acetyltransferase